MMIFKSDFFVIAVIFLPFTSILKMNRTSLKGLVLPQNNRTYGAVYLTSAAFHTNFRVNMGLGFILGDGIRWAQATQAPQRIHALVTI